MTMIYIGVASDFLHGRWEEHPRCRDACHLMRVITGAASVKFVCNSAGNIFDGDVYEVMLHEDDREEFFFLRTAGLAKISAADVAKYYEAHRKYLEKFLDKSSRTCYYAA